MTTRVKVKQDQEDAPSSRTPLCPSLPPELWIRILSYHTDLTHLWMTCRAVSLSLRAYTEQVFAELHLKNTFIDWQLEKYNLGGKSRRPEIPTSFHRFSGDRHKSLVYFRDRRDVEDVVPHNESIGNGKGKVSVKYQMVMDRWEENVTSIRPEMPNYTIEVDGVVNDTEIPSVELDIDDREIAFDWRGMLQAFFKEQERIGVLKKRWITKVTPKLTENGILPPSWPAVCVQSRKQARRERLERYYACDEEKVWALKSLKYYEDNRSSDGRTEKPLSTLPQAGIGQRFFGSTYLVQSLWLDEWSCLQRIERKEDDVQNSNEPHRSTQHTPIIPPTPPPSGFLLPVGELGLRFPRFPSRAGSFV